MYDIFYIGKNDQLKDRFPFAKEVLGETEIKPITTMYWLIDSHTQITNWDIFEFTPDTHTAQYTHQWKWNSENYGGVNLVPKGGSADTVFHNKIVCKRQFDILHEKEPGDYFDLNQYSTHVWCVDPDYVLGDDINWAPGNFEPNFIHSFHLRGQLEYKYPEKEGGIKLFPREWNTADTKYHGYLDASIEYPVMFVTDVNDYAQRNTFKEDYVWLIDKHHKINLDTIDWVPNPFEQNFVHCFRMPYQLKEKYPMAMGGIRLVPRSWRNAETKIHPACPIEDEEYDVFYIDEDEFTSETYTEYADRSKTDWFWIVDRDYAFNGKLLFVPAEHEQEYIHVFKLPGHLDERYPIEIDKPWDTRCGGIRLVNKRFDMTKHKYQEGVVPVRYNIFYVDDLNDYETCARKTRTKMFWMVDSEHQINEEFRYVPQRYDQKFIHIFKFPNDLEHKYPRNITNVSDNRAGGIKLVPVNGSGDAKFINENPVGGKSYPVIQTDDESIQLTEDSWIIPTGVDGISSIHWQPSVFEKNVMHVFASGLIKWKPVEWNGDIKEHDFSPVALDIKYEVFSSYEEGLSKSKFNWFWVVDPEVTVLDNFNWNFQPNVFDNNKAHVWQKLNPITNKQYDYGGVALRHKEEKAGRPKYIREPACVQAEYPVYTLTHADYETGLKQAFDKFAAETTTNMFWVVDDFVKVDDDFDFSYYPTQYDIDVVHTWEHNSNSRASGIRLIPTNTLIDSDTQIIENGFHKLKALPTIATYDPVWPLAKLSDLTAEEVQQILESNKDVPYVWTLEPGIELEEDVVKNSFLPHVNQYDVVHVWKNQGTDGYGGLRLWPTSYNATILSDQQVSTCSIPNQFIMDSVAGPQKQFPVYTLTSDDISKGLKNTYEHLASITDTRMFWVVDPFVEVDKDFDFTYHPSQYEMDVVHVWEHKGDNRLSGVRLVPTKQVYQSDRQIFENSFDKLKEMYTVASKDVIWEVVQLKENTVKEIKQILNERTNCYVWTVDPGTEYDAKTITNGFIPYLDDISDVHVWRNSDGSYGSLKLWPTWYNIDSLDDLAISTSSIPDQIIVDAVAGQRKQFPVYTLTHEDIQVGLKETYERLSAQTESKMFWVVDAFVEVNEEFDFSYMPSQFDLDVVHIWKHASTSRQTGIRLMPTTQQYDSSKQINENSFAKLKQMPQVATKDPVWAVERFNKVGVEELAAILDRNKNVDYVWTCDPDIELDESIIQQSIIPHVDNASVVHVWKRTNSEGLIVGHGGLRLWPTWFDASSLTDEQVITSSVPDQFILDSVAGPQKEYPICVLTHESDIIEQLKQFEETCDLNMYWVVDPFVTYVDDWTFDYIPTKWEENTVHVFLDTEDAQRGVRLIPNKLFTTNNYTVKQIVNNSFSELKVVYRHATQPTVWPVYTFKSSDSINTGGMSLKAQLESFSKDTSTNMFYTVDSDIVLDSQFNFAYTPQLDCVNKAHVWQRLNPRTNMTHSYGGVRLWPNPPTAAMESITSDKVYLNRMDTGKMQYVKQPASTYNAFDVVVLSYLEDIDLVEQKIATLSDLLNTEVLHVRGVTGIFEAHKCAAENVSSDMFWVVDADADVTDDFKFEYIPDVYDRSVVHVWASRNPVTGLEYGYGGVKLFNTKQVLDATTWGLDFTTGLSTRFKSMPQISCITRFNTDAYSTWRSAFRECVKLTLKDDADSAQRLEGWLHPVSDVDFRHEAKLGAEEGRAYALANKNSIAALEKINDYEWLEHRYKAR